jgi:hypothetical protein
MDPDDRLIEKLGEELRRSTAEMRLYPEFREQLKDRMLATPTSPWQRWVSGWPTTAWGRGTLAGVALAAIALAVALPLATSRTPPARSSVSLELVPPEVKSSGVPGAVAAPASCAATDVKLKVTPTRATLTPGQRAQFSVSEIGGSCALGVSISGPSIADLSIASGRPTPNVGGPQLAQATFLLRWTGTGAAAEKGNTAISPGSPASKGGLAAGTYEITVKVPHTRVRASIEITVS